MRILLINPPHNFQSSVEDQVKIRAPIFPLGLGYIASALLQAGHEVEILEINAYQYTQNQITEKLKELKYDVIGIGALVTQYKYVKWLTNTIKDVGDKPVILGGALAFHSSEVVLKNSKVDICVIGEGEPTVVDLLNNLKNPKNVKGIAFREKGKITRTEPREQIKDVDNIPFPAWSLFPMDIYLKYSKVGHDFSEKSMGILSGRGCPYNCNYCSRTFNGSRMRSVDNIIKEIKELMSEYDVRAINFFDELTLISKQRGLELCEKLKPLNIKWSCAGRANLVYEDLLKAAKESGCVRIGYGIESGSQKILDNMNKRVTMEQNKNAIISTLKAGIIPAVPLMYGYPGETKETIQETINLFKDVNYFTKGASITTALPGTPLYADCIKNGLIKDEDAYLESLEKGFASGEKFLINFTDFTEEEFYRYKEKMEKEIQFNYLKKHPLGFVKHVSYQFKLYRQKYGYKQMLIKLAKELKKNSKLLFKSKEL